MQADTVKYFLACGACLIGGYFVLWVLGQMFKR